MSINRTKSILRPYSQSCPVLARAVISIPLYTSFSFWDSDRGIFQTAALQGLIRFTSKRRWRNLSTWDLHVKLVDMCSKRLASGQFTSSQKASNSLNNDFKKCGCIDSRTFIRSKVFTTLSHESPTYQQPNLTQSNPSPPPKTPLFSSYQRGTYKDSRNIWKKRKMRTKIRNWHIHTQPPPNQSQFRGTLEGGHGYRLDITQRERAKRRRKIKDKWKYNETEKRREKGM